MVTVLLYSLLLNECEDIPRCVICGRDLTEKHILIESDDFSTNIFSSAESTSQQQQEELWKGGHLFTSSSAPVGHWKQ